MTRSAACCVPSPVHSDALVLFGGMVDGDVTDEVRVGWVMGMDWVE